MSEITELLILTLIAGMAMPVGALLATLPVSRHQTWAVPIQAGILSFAGGALISAVALVLIPEGIEQLSLTAVVLSFATGGISFMLLDRILAKINNPMGQLFAMLTDFLPEALALGAAIAFNSPSAVLLALLMALQNLPEGYGSYREMMASGNFSSQKLIISFAFIALLGPIAGLTGYYFFAEHISFLASIMIFAAGGILYAVFQDIAPESKIENRWSPALGAVLGFLLGLVGSILTAGGV